MKKNLLAIDDEPNMLKCLEKALEAKGYKLFVTDDPEEGLNIFKKEDISLVLLDIRMPQKSGFDIYKEFREIRRLPVLFVTAYPKSFTAASNEIVDIWTKEFSDGNTDIVYKPFDLDTLYDKVEGLIGEAQEEETVP
jgi:two-component system OmpR family response regulator